MSSFCICKSYSHFFSKNTCESDIVLTRTVDILTTDKHVKLMMFWTTGPSIFDWKKEPYLTLCFHLQKHLNALSVWRQNHLSCFINFYFYYSHDIILTLKAPSKHHNCSRHNSIILSFKQNKYWHFMWIVCQADNSHKMSNLLALKKKKKYFKSRLLLILPGTLRINVASISKLLPHISQYWWKNKISICIHS